MNVSHKKRSGKYEAFFRVNSKRHYLGAYELAADAAWAQDLCLQQLDLPSKEPNFKTTTQYYTVRKKEAKDRGINILSPSKIQEYLTSKVSDAVSAIVKEGGTLKSHTEKEGKTSNNERWAY